MHLDDDVEWVAEDFVPLEDADLPTLQSAVTRINRITWDEAWLRSRLLEEEGKANSLPNSTEKTSRLVCLGSLKQGQNRRTIALGLLERRLKYLVEEKEKERVT